MCWIGEGRLTKLNKDNVVLFSTRCMNMMLFTMFIIGLYLKYSAPSKYSLYAKICFY